MRMLSLAAALTAVAVPAQADQLVNDMGRIMATIQLCEEDEREVGKAMLASSFVLRSNGYTAVEDAKLFGERIAHWVGVIRMSHSQAKLCGNYRKAKERQNDPGREVAGDGGKGQS